MNRKIKLIISYLLCLFLLTRYSICIFAAVKPIYNTEIISDETSEKEFIEGINKRQRFIYISNMNQNNKDNLTFYLVYKYFPNIYTQDWLYERLYGNIAVICLYYKKDGRYFITFSDEAYRRLDNELYNEDYDKFIDGIIKSANINENMSALEVIYSLVNYICNSYVYDSDTFCSLLEKRNIQGWQITRDYNISICNEDSKIFKSCLNKLDIECRIVGNVNHIWNQVLIDGKWTAVDISYYRDSGKYYIFFDDSDRLIENIFN